MPFYSGLGRIKRLLITAAAPLVALFLLSGLLERVSAVAPFLNPIQKENRQPGTTAWQLTNPADNRQIEGYASLTSVPVGGNINLFVNTAEATYSLTVYRMGWYEGTGGRRVLGPQTLNGVKQVTPTADPITGLIECHWTNPFPIHVPTSWTSGVYLVKLHGDNSGKESYIVFTVRDSRSAALVFQQSVTTYQAYNPWPGWDPNAGYVGESLYGFQNNDQKQATQVSFNRPYGRGPQATTLNGAGAGEFLTLASGGHDETGGSAWEFEMLRWLEHQGYDVTYITDVDTHEDVGRLLRGKAFLSVGHDEYWSEQMRSNVMEAVSQGVSLGFFSANYIYWPITFLPDSSGFPDRTISAPKDTICGDVYECGTFAFRCNGHPCDPNAGEDPKVSGETEQLLVGGMWSPGHYGPDGDIVVPNDASLNHWVFANTGLQVGDVIPGLVGIEFDAVNSDFPRPNGLQILLHTQLPSFGDWAMTIYQAPSGAWVFNAATMQWSWGLDNYFTGLHTPDGANNGPAIRTQCGNHAGLVGCRNPAIEQITGNVLNRFISG